MSNIVNKLKNSYAISSIVCHASRFLNSISKFNTVKGKNNKLNFHALTFFSNVKIKISGNNNTIETKGRVALRNLKIEMKGNNNHLILEDGVRFYEKGHLLFEGDNCTTAIGKKTTVGSASIFCTESNTNIIIGEDCMLGREIKILTGDFHSIIDLETKKRINPSKSIHIGNHVWIGFHACVSKGAVISDNSVVASYSLVNKENLEKNVILGGSPSKVIKKNIDWDRKKLPIT